MKGFFSYYLTILLLVLLGVLYLWYFHPQNLETSTTLSPLPDFLTLSKNHEVSTMDLFLPVINLLTGSTQNAPIISAKAAVAYDITTGKTLYSKNPNKRLPMASLTKVMTAIISFENKLSSNIYYVHNGDLVGEDSMGLAAGESLTLEELLYGLILPSGNDAAEVLASNYVLGRSAFIDAMNNKVKALGIKNTHYTNPSGLEGDGDQYTTPYDLVVITKYALTTYPLFATVAQTPEYNIPQTTTHKAYTLYNETNLLTTYPGVKGVKTGYTPEAGYCLITYLDYKGHKIIAVLLGSTNRRQEMKDILDFSLKSLGETPPKHS